MYFRASRTSPNELSGWYGEPAPARDTLDRIIKRGLVLNEYPDHSGIRITKHQQARIRCILLSLSNPGTDDRYLTYQSVLDWTNNTVENPYFSSARQWLLPESEIKSGHIVTDKEIRHRLVNAIDWQIIHCRDQVKRRFEQQGDAIPIRVRRANEWMANQQRNPRSIYQCYRS